MLVNMNKVLYPAMEGNYAVGLFNAVNLELARGIIAAAEGTGFTGHHGDSRNSFTLWGLWRRYLII